MPGVKAEEFLESGSTKHLTGEEYEALVFTVTGSKIAAARAKQDRRAAQLEAGVEVT